MEDGTIKLPALGSLELRTHPERGRGVFTTSFIPKGTLVTISPVLLFDHHEYAEHGKYTKLDDYTYCWKGGYALALGLGSMFNHEPFGSENVGFMRDFENSLIRYKTLRDIKADEELCICYGQNVWFDIVSEGGDRVSSNGVVDEHKEPSETAEEFLSAFEM